MNRNDKNRKYAPLNINNVFKGKSVEAPNKTNYRSGGMQNIGKVSSMRRVPPPKWVPSLKAESGATEKQIINPNSSGWMPTSQENQIQIDSENSAKSSEKSQWNLKSSANKPFFLIGQEFPTLNTDGNPDSQEMSVQKDISKLKDDRVKMDDIRNRDTSISISTLNRIDALSVSKTSKGDIAATGWAAEDEEPNFDEKIVFSDEESLHDYQIWPSDNEESVKRSELTSVREKCESQTLNPEMWQEHSPSIRYQPYQQIPMAVNVQNQFLTNQQFQQNLISRNSASPGTPLCDDQSLYPNSVVEQRNARNMEYYIAIERARQKKMATQSNHSSSGQNEEHNQEHISMRSRHTSVTSDTPDSLNISIETGPPGGPPLLHIHKQHIQPHMPQMMPHSPIIIPSQLTGTSSMLRFPQPHTIMMPIPTAVPLEHVTDAKLLEKWMEFLKLQSNTDVNYDAVNSLEHSQIVQSLQGIDTKPSEEFLSEPVERPSSQHLIGKETVKTVEKKLDICPENLNETLRDSQKASQINEDYKSDQKLSKTKYKDFRQTRPVYKNEYGNVEQGFYEEEDTMAYKDYNTYKQHYSHERGRRKYRKNYYQTESSTYANRDNYSGDYYYRSNSLKTRPTKFKDTGKSTNVYTDNSPAEKDQKDFNFNTRKSCDDYKISEKTAEIPETKDKEFRKGGGSTSKSTNKSANCPTKRFDNHPSYKERSTESKQEYSMGFAVNPKDSRRNYYTGVYNRRFYSDYYYNYPPNNGSASHYDEYDDSYYYQDFEYQYDKDSSYPSSKSVNKRSKNVPVEQWRYKDDKLASKSKFENGNLNKPGNRNNRKTDKRQTSMSKDGNNDNDQEEWETASEGGSERSIGGNKESTKSGNRQGMYGGNLDSKSAQNAGLTRKGVQNKQSSNYPCNSNRDIQGADDDDDDDHFGTGEGHSSGVSSVKRIHQSKSGESSKGKNEEAGSSCDNRNSDSASTNCSNNNNSSKDVKQMGTKPLSSSRRNYSDFIDLTNVSAVIIVDKLPEVTEDEELLYENTEQFQEVLSKATKKSRKLEEQKRIKEEMKLEQKKNDSSKSKIKIDGKHSKKIDCRKDPLPKVNKLLEIKKSDPKQPTVVVNREKEIPVVNSPHKNWETPKLAIGSWDNSLADDIKSDRRNHPKPIGTPASFAWNKKNRQVSTYNTSVANSSTNCQSSLTTRSSEPVESQIDVSNSVFTVSSENSKLDFRSSMKYPYNNPIFIPSSSRGNDEKTKIENPIETVSAADLSISEAIDFDYEVKNLNCGSDSNRNSVNNNDQQSLNDKINSVKTIWESQTITMCNNNKDTNKIIVTSVSQELSIQTTAGNANGDISTISRNIDTDNLSTPSLSNVCKVRPQLQQDYCKKEQNETNLTQGGYPMRHSPAAFVSQNLSYPHRFTEFVPDQIHPPEAFTPLLTNQTGMQINYNPHLIDSALLRQNSQDHIFANKLNFINQSQSSFYPQQAATPKLITNNPLQPLNMDLNSAHSMQQLLLTRQNSITSMMQPNHMPLSFIQNGQQTVQAQASLFPPAPLLGPTNFSSQINPFSQGHIQTHYPTSNFPSLHHTSPFQPNQQLLLNHPHHQQQQLIPGHLAPPDRVIGPGHQSGPVFNPILGPSDLSTNPGLSDFNGQPKPLTHNNIMHGLNGSTFMLPPNLNILMKSPLFATNSQYNNFTPPIQSSLLNLKSGFDNNSGFKTIDVEPLTSENSLVDNIFCSDLSKSMENFSITSAIYNNCNVNNENWPTNFRPNQKLEFNNSNSLLHGLDLQSQRSSLQFSPINFNLQVGDNRNLLTSLRCNQISLATGGINSNPNFPYTISPRSRQSYHQDSSSSSSCVKPNIKYADNSSLSASANQHFHIKSDSADAKKVSAVSEQSMCVSSSIMNNDSTDNHSKTINTEKASPSEIKKEIKQRSSFSDNFDDKRQSWPNINVDDNIDEPLEDSNNSNSNKPLCNKSQKNNSGDLDKVLYSPHKQQQSTNSCSRSNLFDICSPFGYDETQLSNETAESLGKLDQCQLKKVIMKLREGPVMTDNNCNEFDFNTYKGNSIPRLVPIQSRPKQQSNSSSSNPKSLSNNFCPPALSTETYHNKESVSMGFYSKSRALTPPVLSRSQKNKLLSRSQNSYGINSTSANSHHSFSINSNSHRPAKSKCDIMISDKDLTTVSDLKTNVQSRSIECDNHAVENVT